MSKKFSPIPVTVISGFLGAGKTTLLNRILNGDHGRKIAVMVNDFGEINIDSQLIVSAEQSMVNLSNGCICCTVESDLIEQLHKLINLRERPEYILIETSGVSDPSKVVNTLCYPQFRQQLTVDAVVAIIDADNFSSLDGDRRKLAMDQLSVADIVVINKTDLATTRQVESFRQQWLYPYARVFETQFADIPVELLLGTELFETNHSPSKSGHQCNANCDHNHNQQFATYSWESDQPLSLSKLRHALKQLPENLYRAKGFVYLAESPKHRCKVHLVGSRVEIEKEERWQQMPKNQLVMIGWNNLDAAHLNQALESCYS